MAVAGSGRRASREEERLGLLEIARARGIGGEDVTALPPGQRDATGFWFPAGYREPLELFTPRQRSLQAQQRVLQARRGRPSPAPAPPTASGAPAPPRRIDVASDQAAPVPDHGPSRRDHELRALRPPIALRVDSPERSV